MKMFKTFFLAGAAFTLSFAPAFAETLKELSGHTHYHGIAFARSGSATLLLATHHGIFAIDRTGTATQVSPVHDYMGFAPHPADPLTYYASGHPSGGGNSGFLKSTDGGSTWEQHSEGVGGPVDFHQMDVSPADPSVVYGVYRDLQVSRDGGQTWSIAGTPPAKLVFIAASGVKPGRIYAATQNGLHMSGDAGANWHLLEFDGEVVSMIKGGLDGALLAFVLGRGLVKAREDKPKEWTVLSNGLADAIPLHFAIDPADSNHFALTTQANDVLESRDGGSTWTTFGKTP